MKSIANLRKEYILQSLEEKDADKDPFAQFTKWWMQAMASNIDDVNAMTLATANKLGIPSARIVLLKDYDEKGFVFFTNFLSHKANDLEENPNAALVFYWKELERQVRIQGSTTKVNNSISDAYFESRPEGSKLGAWASPQSTVIPGRHVLEIKINELQNLYAGKEIMRPAFWGGYNLKPSVIEFWQGRQNRLHDRLQYRLQENDWKLERLAP
ncbi:MAG: pyridoxamine 5'-phosphate oxidase [Ferruginibacter sp.]